MTFTAGHVRIVHGCYTNTADVTAGRGTLDVTNVQLVRGLPCPSNGVTDVDHQLDDVVSGRVTWTVHGQTLKITNGATTLDFERSHR